MSEDMRDGEVAINAPPPEDARIGFVGRIRTPFATPAECPRQGDPDGPLCRIEVDPPWGEALEGIDRFESIEVLYWLDQSRRDLVKQSPKSDGTATGTLSLIHISEPTRHICLSRMPSSA